MTRRNAVFSLILVMIFSSTALMAWGPTNARLRGLGGAGVSIAPIEGQTALSINPAAPGFMKNRQINFNVGPGLGSGDASDYYGYDREWDYFDFAAGAEFFFPVGPLQLFFGLGPHTEFGEDEVYDYADYYSETRDWFILDMHANIGLAYSFADMVGVGGQVMFWHDTSSVDEDWGDDSATMHTDVLVGQLGVMVVTPIDLNAGLTYRTDDGDFDTDEHYYNTSGVREEIRLGLSYQPNEGAWLVGAEFVDRDDLDIDVSGIYGNFTSTYYGSKAIHVFGEYWIDDFGLRGGLSKLDGDTDEGDFESFALSLGCGIRMSDKVGMDLYLQRIDNEETGNYGYISENEYWRVGLGMTFQN